MCVVQVIVMVCVCCTVDSEGVCVRVCVVQMIVKVCVCVCCTVDSEGVCMLYR